ncbi:hypothetical protein BD779DRAFT_1691671 [Infundibulicybe gibba]|nr:hypothetical protein BD779DRAFT_1691671 [Infundibulicybe gibba]
MAAISRCRVALLLLSTCCLPVLRHGVGDPGLLEDARRSLGTYYFTSVADGGLDDGPMSRSIGTAAEQARGGGADVLLRDSRTQAPDLTVTAAVTTVRHREAHVIKTTHTLCPVEGSSSRDWASLGSAGAPASDGSTPGVDLDARAGTCGSSQLQLPLVAPNGVPIILLPCNNAQHFIERGAWMMWRPDLGSPVRPNVPMSHAAGHAARRAPDVQVLPYDGSERGDGCVIGFRVAVGGCRKALGSGPADPGWPWMGWNGMEWDVAMDVVDKMEKMAADRPCG